MSSYCRSGTTIPTPHWGYPSFRGAQGPSSGPGGHWNGSTPSLRVGVRGHAFPGHHHVPVPGVWLRVLSA